MVFCSGDGTYRSPVAAAVLKKCFEQDEELKNIDICAKGMIVMFPEPVNGKAVAIGNSKGYNLSEYSAQGITRDDFSIETLVLVMTDMGKKKVYDAYDNAINVYTIKEFIGAAGDIDIPFGKGLADYGENFNQLESLIKQVADKLIKIK